MTLDFSVELITSINDVNAHEWDTLLIGHDSGDATPLLSHAFLSALENSGSVGLTTGWNPHPLIVRQGTQLVGAMPLYLKSHSYGEYVFDWAWADAYARSGLNYYPKLLSAIPFSPVTSARILSSDTTPSSDTAVASLMVKALETTMHQHNLSSAHVLFPDDASVAHFEAAGWLKRTGVQFRWQNKNYGDFEDFLATLSHDKRKKIHQERKKIQHAGVVCRWIKGQDATEKRLGFFSITVIATLMQNIILRPI